MDAQMLEKGEFEKRVIFQNKGLLDLRCIDTFGISVKEHDNPIGQFGTGLKYAIAILLRYGIEITLWLGSKPYHFTEVFESVRGQEFGFVYMNDVKLPFTTELGKHWELWMAFRELYSNTVDEQGSTWLADETDEINKEWLSTYTTIVVCGEDFAQILEDKADVFIQSDPIMETEEIAIHEGETNAIFNRGIKIKEFEKPLMDKYDLKKPVALTEDRTLLCDSDFDRAIRRIVITSDDPNYIAKVLQASKDYYESGINFAYITRDEISDTFKSTLKALIKKGKAKLNPTVVRFWDEVREKAASKVIKETYTVYIPRPKSVTQDEMTEWIRNTIQEAITEIDDLGLIDSDDISAEVY